MKRKLAVLLATVVVALGLLLGASTTQAAEVILDDSGNVSQILNLSVFIFQTDTYELYNVEFKYGTAVDVFGDGETVGTNDFDFPSSNDTVFSARYAVDNALNSNDPFPQGAGEQGTDDFFIPSIFANGYAVIAAGGENLAGVWSPCEEQCIDFDPDVGAPDAGDPNLRAGIAVLSPVDNYTWADFTLVSAVPDPVTIGGTVTGLEGSGLVLQNNDIDDLPIAVDGPFTFATPLTPGTPYNVTVLTQPEGQTCSVTNGSGVVPDVDVTDVAVSCAEEAPSFARAAQNSVLANLYSAATVNFGVLASDDPANIPLVQLYASVAYDFAEDAFNDATAALAAAGQNATFWGVYAVQYAETDMNLKAEALSYFDQALAAYQANDLEAAEAFLDSGFLSTSMAVMNNGNTIWTASTESTGATK